MGEYSMRRYLLILILLIPVGYALTGLTQVRPGEVGVIRRFGRVLETHAEPGLHFGLPWGMDRVDRVAVDRLRPVKIGYDPDAEPNPFMPPAGQLLTGDHNIVNVQIVLNYQVRRQDVTDFVIHADEVDSLVARVAETVLTEWVASRRVDEVLRRGNVQLPSWIVAETQRRLEAYHLGVAIRDASIGHLFPPTEVKAAFDAVTQAETEKRTRKNDAEKDAARKISEAEGHAERLRQIAQAYTVEEHARAVADADRFESRRLVYEQMKHDHSDALTAIWWEEMGKVFANLREGGRVDLLDNHLGPDGLDITIVAPLKKK
jgi:membrane protease subunit HflK